MRAPGIAVYEHLRTSYPDVYAVGDIAVPAACRPAEQWTKAIEAADHVAQCLIADASSAPPSTRPYGWSQQFGHMILLAGDLGRAPRTATFVDNRRRLVLTGDVTIDGAFAIDNGKALMRARKLFSDNTPWNDALAEMSAFSLAAPDIGGQSWIAGG